MRILPEGAEEWAKPLGKFFCILAAILAVAGLMAFLRQEYIWHKWPTTDGVVIDSQLITSRGENDSALCSASYKVRYFINGRDYTSDHSEHVSSSDCAGWKSRVSSAKGTHRTVLYNPDNSTAVYVDPGYNFNFFGLPFVLLCLAVAFALGGVTSWRMGSYMVRHNIRFP